MNENMILNKKKTSNKGSGLGVILYGITLLFVLLFTAINIVNSKVIENGYLSLRDAVQTASSSSVIHLLTAPVEDDARITNAQKTVIEEASYDIYLQLALGYLINRNQEPEKNDDTVIQTGEINNFIKLDHQKVVNTTLALLEDAVIRRKDRESLINNTEEYKIMMFFIEPYRTEDGKKYFDIIAYGNGASELSPYGYTIKEQLAKTAVRNDNYTSMEEVYRNVETAINNMVNCEQSVNSNEIKYYKGIDDKSNYGDMKFNISLNAEGTSNYDKLIREMETYPHYLIVVKDFALPTIFDSKNTNDVGSGIKSIFTSISGDGKLAAPMCALNTGKVQRQVEEAGWRQDR